METYIPMQDVIYSINNHPDLTKEDKRRFQYITNSLNLSEKGKERIILSNEKKLKSV